MTAKVYVIGNLKGGVSKTTLTTMFAYQTALFDNERTLVIDMDPSPGASLKLAKSGDVDYLGTSITNGFLEGDLEPEIISIKNNLDLIPSNSSFGDLTRLLIRLFPDSLEDQFTYLKKLIEPLKEKYDRIFIDTPPSQLDYHKNAIMAADYCIIAFQTQEPSLEAAKDYIDLMSFMVENFDANLQVLGVVPVFTNKRSEEEKFVFEKALDLYGGNVLNTKLYHQERIKGFATRGIEFRKLPSGRMDMWDLRAHEPFKQMWKELMINETDYETA